MCKKVSINQYTPEGRKELYKPPDVDVKVMHYIMYNPKEGRSVEYNDNRISLYVGQKGKCAVTGQALQIGSMHTHHKIPKQLGGKDNYSNLVFVTDEVHRLIHAKNDSTISEHTALLKLSEIQITKLNKLRVLTGHGEVI